MTKRHKIDDKTKYGTRDRNQERQDGYSSILLPAHRRIGHGARFSTGEKFLLFILLLGASITPIFVAIGIWWFK